MARSGRAAVAGGTAGHLYGTCDRYQERPALPCRGRALSGHGATVQGPELFPYRPNVGDASCPMILALDTSTDWCSVALYDPTGSVRAEQTWYAHRDQTAQLLPTVQFMLERAGLTLAEVRSLAVALGPGSFTGLRVGLATAKGLAYA